MRRLHGEDGLMLTELLVGMVIAIVVFGATVTMLEVFFRQSARTNHQAHAQDAARTAVDRMAGQLRNGVGVLGQTTQPIEQRGAYDVVFLAPDPASALGASNTQGLMHVRYCLDNSVPSNETLWFQSAPASYTSTTPPTVPTTSTCPAPVTAGVWATKQAVATNLVNQNGAPAKPLFNMPATGDVADVAIDAWVDADPTGGVPASELRTSVTLRNLNRSPVASVSCTAAGNGHANCDASASSDPDGGTLFYSWYMDGTTAANKLNGEASYRLDKAGLTAGSTHTFYVFVQDTGGVTVQSAAQTVVVQ